MQSVMALSAREVSLSMTLRVLALANEMPPAGASLGRFPAVVSSGLDSCTASALESAFALGCSATGITANGFDKSARELSIALPAARAAVIARSASRIQRSNLVNRHYVING